jgi:hypothetical protein
LEQKRRNVGSADVAPDERACSSLVWPQHRFDAATKMRRETQFRIQRLRHPQTEGETAMAKGEQKSNRETKKPKKEKIKTIAAAPSQKGAGWQPTMGTGKKK